MSMDKVSGLHEFQCPRERKPSVLCRVPYVVARLSSNARAYLSACRVGDNLPCSVAAWNT